MAGAPSSPDPNQIDDISSQIERRMHRRERQVGRPAHGKEESIVVAQEEWELIDCEGVEASAYPRD